MTKEEIQLLLKDLCARLPYGVKLGDSILRIGEKKLICILSLKQMDWLNAHHFDYCGLIEKGLALEAPEDMYK